MTHHVFVRADLPAGAAAAQIVHAAGESVSGRVPPDTFAIVLAVDGEPALRALAAKLAMAGTDHAAIVETDGAMAGQMTAIGVAPCRRSARPRFFASFPLYGRVAQSRAPAAKPEVGGSRPPSPTNLPGSSNGGRPRGNAGLNPAPGSNAAVAQEAERQE